MTDHQTNVTQSKGLSKAKQALLARRLRGELKGMPQADTIPVRTDAGLVPLSYAQERFWFMYQLAPKSPAYNMYNMVRLQGRLNTAALRQSFGALIRRHEILRTQFVANNGRPFQQIVSDVVFEIPITDLQTLTGPEQERQVQELIRAEIRRPFDLTQCPLLRVLLVKQANDDHILVLTIHHIISDEWSNELFWRELSTLYRAFVSSQTPSLSELPIQYADFTLWQKQRVETRMETQLAYWKKQLDVEFSLLRLPTDHPRPAQQTFRGALTRLNLPDELYVQIKALNQAYGATTFMTLLAAFQLLLHRYSGQTDILVGVPIANRSHSQTKNLIGLFLNTLVMRANFENNPRVDELLKRIRQTALDGYAHQDLPFEVLVDKLHPQRDASHNPIFQVMFVHQNSAPDEINLPGLTVSEVPVDLGVAKFDLTLFVQESEQGLSAGLEYNTDLFDSGTADRILSHFKTLLEHIAANPQQRISDVQIITADEQNTLLRAWNDTRRDMPQPPQIQHLVEQYAVQTPEAVAVVDHATQLTYSQLDQRANRLAHFLQKQGVGPNTPVGLLLERSTDMIVAILGVLKAGGAYLPLDPTYPPERLAFMLADTQAPVLLTQKKLAGSRPEGNAKTVFIDVEWGVIAEEKSTAPTITASPENWAYVIYTSGSTGQPKGVPVSHRNLVHSTSARFEFYQKNADRFLLLSSFTFDSSVVGIFWTLCQGGTLVLPPQRIEQDMQQLAATIAAHQISHILTLPSLYAILLEQADAAQLASLQTVIVAGEACRPGLAERHYARLPQTSLFNEYGPTEGTVWSTAYRIPPTFKGDRVPIGQPIPNVQNYILDKYGQPAPIGVPGELCIGGAGVTQGYLNRPELTAEKFVEYTFAGEPPTRLYRTGDLARYLPDGNIEFLGRLDQQVKVRGFRIEIGEIEAALAQHPAVQQAAVVVVHPPAGRSAPAGKQLAAYVEPVHGQQISAGQLRRFLLDKLPDYMIPSTFTRLDALPITPNGKVDRKKLPALEVNPAQAPDSAFVTPRTPVEEKLAAIWADVLGLKTVGIRDNFFEIGGDSILSIQIIAKAAQQNVKLKPNDIFRYPTIATLAGVARIGGSEIETQQTAVTGPVPLTPIQRWFFEQDLDQPHHWNQSYFLELAPDIDLTLLEQSLQQLLLHHDALRLRFNRVKSGWIQENAGAEQTVRVERFNLSELPKPEQTVTLERIAQELQQSLDLAGGCLLRAAVFEPGPQESMRLLLVIHHLAIDGISWQILLDDLQTAYYQLQRGEPVQLPRKTSSFQQWAERLTEFAQLAELKKDLDFWLNNGSVGEPALQPDFPHGLAKNTVGSSATVTVTLTAHQTNALLHRVPAAYQTQINDTLLTALLLAFAKQTGSDRLFFDLEGHGREALFEDVDLSRTVGWFTTVFPMCLELAEDSDVGETLIGVKEYLRQVPRKGLSYGLLRYLSQDETLRQKLAQQPQPKITFNYLGQFDQTLSDFLLFQTAPESRGEERNPHDLRRYLLDINSMVEQGQLVINWSYSQNCFRPETIEDLADSFIENLQAIIEHCTAPESGGYTPSDFPLAYLSQTQLNQLVLDVSSNSREVNLPDPAKNIETIYPLSPMQQLMLLHAASQPNSSVLFTQVRYALAGLVDTAALQKSWQKIVARHPALRTVFSWEHTNSPLQIVWQDARLDFEQIDLRHLSPANQRAKLADILVADRLGGFKLTQPPLMRLKLVRLADDLAQLVWSNHHLVMDRWCINIILQEMLLYYENAVGHDRTVQPEPARPFADYIAWLLQQNQQEAEAFWRQRLSGFTRPTLLVDPVAARPTNNQQTLAKNISKDASQTLQAVTRQSNLTMNTLVQGGWALLLGQLCQADDVLFGATVSGRPADIAGVESIVGSFINNLPVRVKINRTQLLLDWLQEIQTQQIAMQPYEYADPALIQAWSNVPDKTPLFDTLLIFQAPLRLEKDPNKLLQVTGVDGELSTIYPLTLSIVEEAGQLQLWAIYDSGHLDATAVKQLLSHLTHLLGAMADNANQPVGDVLNLVKIEPLLPQPVRQTNDTPRPATGPSNSPAVISRTDTERQMSALWETILGISPIGVRDNFFELGGTSLQAMHLFTRIAAQFGQSLPLVSLIQGGTIEHLAKMLQGDQASSNWSALVPIQPEGTNPPFFCIHGITGDVLWFRELGRCLAPDQPLYGIQARGLDGISKPFSRVEPMAAYYIEQMRTLQPHGPYYFGGASFGGTVALEMAQQLIAQGEEVGLVVMFDHAPVQAIRNHISNSSTSKVQAGWQIVKNFPHWLNSFVQLGAGPIMARVRRKSRLAVKQIGNKTGLLSPNGTNVEAADVLDYGAEMPDFRQKMIEDHFQAIESYSPKPYPGRVTLFQARAQPLISTVDPLAGWKLLEVKGLDFEIVAGSHEGMFKSPNVEGLAQRLRERILRSMKSRDLLKESGIGEKDQRR